MNKILIILTVFALLSACKTTKPAAPSAGEINSGTQSTAAPAAATDYSSQATWVLGYFEIPRLKQEPHGTWYFKGYDEYQPDKDAVATLRTIPSEDVTIKVIMGTWCPDSRREVPRFMKIMDDWQFPYGKITFIGVDNVKLSPVGDYDKLEIHRVPTFIIYKNNIEAGRIIENPVTSLEQDMINILGGIKTINK